MGKTMKPKNTRNTIEEAREMASACSPIVAKMLNEMADELERLPLADFLAYMPARINIECNAITVKKSKQDDMEHWYMITGLRNDFNQQNEVRIAIAYLKLRGLIEYDEYGLVRVLDENTVKES